MIGFEVKKAIASEDSIYSIGSTGSIGSIVSIDSIDLKDALYAKFENSFSSP